MPLIANTQANRRKMKDRIVTLVESLGARAVAGKDEDRRLRVEVQAARGLCVGINLDARHGEGFLLSWNIDLEHYQTVRLADAFNGINPHHNLKATHSVGHFEGLLSQLDRCIRMANDGSAFRPDDETARLNAESKVRYNAMVARSRSLVPDGCVSAV